MNQRRFSPMYMTYVKESKSITFFAYVTELFYGEKHIAKQITAIRHYNYLQYYIIAYSFYVTRKFLWKTAQRCLTIAHYTVACCYYTVIFVNDVCSGSWMALPTSPLVNGAISCSRLISMLSLKNENEHSYSTKHYD